MTRQEEPVQDSLSGLLPALPTATQPALAGHESPFSSALASFRPPASRQFLPRQISVSWCCEFPPA